MEEKYRKIAVDLGLRKENNECCQDCCMPIETTPLEREQAKKIEKLEFQVKTLTTLLVENKSSFDNYEKNFYQSENNFYNAYKKIELLNTEIIELKEIIDKLMEKRKK